MKDPAAFDIEERIASRDRLLAQFNDRRAAAGETWPPAAVLSAQQLRRDLQRLRQALARLADAEWVAAATPEDIAAVARRALGEIPERRASADDVRWGPDLPRAEAAGG